MNQNNLLNFIIFVCMTTCFSTLAQTGCVIDTSVKINTLMVLQAPIPAIDSSKMENRNNPPGPTILEDRTIMWLHGLGGSKESWGKAALVSDIGTTGFPARKVFNIRETYEETFGIDGAAAQMLSLLKGHASAHQQTPQQKNANYIIAHSQGGQVVRTMNYLAESDINNQNFGGLVTFTSPHHGARVLNNVRNEEVGRMASWACGLLTEPIFIEEVNKLWVLDLLIDENKFFKENVEGTFCNGIVGSIADFLAFKLGKSPTSDAYYVGAPHLTTLENYELSPSRTFRPRRINIYSHEPDDGYLVWRTAQYQIKNPNLYNYFEANEDSGPGTIKNQVDDLHKKFLDKRAEWEHKLNAIPGPGDIKRYWFSLIFGPTVGLVNYQRNARDNRDAYERSLEFFEQINNKYKVIIGAREWGNETYQCECIKLVLTDPNHPTTVTFDWSNEPDCLGHEGYYAPSTAPAYVLHSCHKKSIFQGQWIEKASDGVVVMESAMNLPGSDWEQPITNSSHMQIRNDYNTRTQLYNLYEGLYIHYFETKRR